MRPWWTFAAIAVLAMPAACGGNDKDAEQTTVERDCQNMDRTADAQAGVTTFLVDVSASVRGAQQVPDYRAALKEQIGRAIHRGDVVNIGSFDGSAASVRWSVQGKFTTLTASRDHNKAIQTEHFTTCLGDAVERAATTAPATDNTDVQGALKAGSEAGNATTRRTLVLATDGLSTTGCINLADGPAGKLRWIDTIVAQCPGQADWPAALEGADLVMLGVGHPAEGLPTTSGVEFLRRLWEGVCVVAKAASCEISTDPISSVAATATSGTPTRDTTVTFVADASAPPAPPPQDLVFPVDSLFTTGSADLSEEGAELITRRVEQFPRSAQIEVVGHADARDTPAHNLTLSRDRANNVANVLRTAGFSAVKASGVGEKDAQCSQLKLADNQWNEPCLSRDRKIVLNVKVD